MESSSSKRRLGARETEGKALELRKKGYTYRQIAKEIGCHETTAFHRVKNALQRLTTTLTESAEELRRIELEKLDYLENQLQTGIENFDTKAILAALKIQESRRKLMGLDSPVKQSIEVNSNLSAEELRGLLKQRGVQM